MIIGISGKKRHGKDTVCKMIQYLIYYKIRNLQDNATNFVLDCIQDKNLDLRLLDFHSGWQNRKFAERLKQIVCILIGCTMEQLEDEEFKETELGEEWSCYIIPVAESRFPKIFPIDIDIEWIAKGERYFKRNMTPRMLLQLLGTECGRNIIHPNIWINGLMSEYKPIGVMQLASDSYIEYLGNRKDDYCPKTDEPLYPNWIISDVRFPDEAKAIRDKNGHIIRVNNSRIGWTGDHESETAMDDYTLYDKIFKNSSSLEYLLGQIKEFLQDINLI